MLGRDWRLLKGERRLWRRFGNAEVCLASGSFMQASLPQLAQAYRLSVREIGLQEVELCLGFEQFVHQ